MDTADQVPGPAALALNVKLICCLASQSQRDNNTLSVYISLYSLSPIPLSLIYLSMANQKKIEADSIKRRCGDPRKA